MKKASGTYYSIINPNSFLFTLIIIFILVCGAASIIAYKHYKRALLYAIAENKSTANFLSSLVYEHQKATIGILESYSHRPLFIDAIQKKDFHQVVYHLESLSEHYTELDALFLTDQYGTLWANYPVDREGFGKNLAYRDWYKGVSKNWRPYISSVYRLIVLEKGLAVAVSVPVFDRKGKVIGILSSAHRTFFLAALIRANTLNPRKGITLLDQEGNIIYSDIVDYEKEITKYLHFSPIQEAIRNGKNILEIPDPVRGRKEDVLAFSPIKDMGWTVIVSQKKRAILRSETTDFIEISAIAFLLFVCMTIAPLLLRRDYQYRETKELLTQEKKLWESEERYRNLVESISDVIYTIDSSGVLTYISPVVKNTLGYEPDELIGRQFLELVHKEDHDFLMRRFSDLRKGIVSHSDYRVIGKHGDIKWVRTLTNPIIKEGGFVGVRGVLIDITERKQREEEYRTILRTAIDGFWIVDMEGRFLDVNDAYCHLVGYGREELLTMRIQDVEAVERPEETAQRIQKIIKTGGDRFETRHRRKDGRILDIEVSANYLEVGDGRFFVFLRDITERKQAEEALRKSEEKYRELINNIPDVTWTTDREGHTIFISPHIKEVYGYTPEEIYADHELWLGRVHPDDIERVMIAFESLLTKKEKFDIEYRIQRKDGLWIWVHDRSFNVREKDGRRYADGLFTDITGRKRTEEVLRESEEKSGALIEAAGRAGEGIIIIQDSEEHEGAFVFVNDQFCRMSGYSREELLGRSAWDLVPHEISVRLRDWYKRRHMGESPPHHYEAAGVRKDGAIVPLELSTVTMPWQGKIATALYLRDITERKQAEGALRQAEEKYRTILESMEEGYFEVDLAGNLTFFNDSVRRMLGYTRDELMGMNNRQYMDKETAQELYQAFNRVYTTGESLKIFDYEIIRKDGAKRFFETSISLIKNPKGERIGFRGIVRDITARKRAEEALHASETKYRIVADNTYDWEFWTSPEGRFLYSSPSCKRITGHGPDEFMAESDLLYRIVHPGDRPDFDRHRDEITQKIGPHEVEFRVIRPDGTVRWIGHACQPVFAPDGHFLGTRGSNRDITEHKQAEEALQASKELFEKTFVSQRDAIFLLDAINPPTILDCNPAATEVFGYTRQEMVGRTMDFLHVDETALREFQRHLYPTIFEHGFLHLFEFRMRRKDETVFPTEHSVTPLEDEQGERIGWVSVVRDITEHKQSEEKLRTYQEQLRSLVTELSLVEEQERRRIATDLHDNIGQILAMTKIKLGALREKESSIDLTRPVDEIRKLIEQAIQYTRSLTFDLSPPVLYELGFEAAVEWLTEQIQEQSGILIDFEDDKKPKPMDDKVYIPLFKAVRELLINIVKHAQAHKAKVSIRREGNNIRIRVEDDGVGFDTSKMDCFSKTGAFGLFSIYERMNSVGGYLEVQSQLGQGTWITLVTSLIQNKKKKEESHDRKNSHCRRPQNCSRRPPHFT